LRDVHEVLPVVARSQEARQPVDPELRLLAEHDLLGRDARTADLDVHVEVLVLVVALGLRGVVAGELRLRDPLELQGDLRGLALPGVPTSARLLAPAATCEEEARDRKGEQPQPALVHPYSLSFSTTPVRPRHSDPRSLRVEGPP